MWHLQPARGVPPGGDPGLGPNTVFAREGVGGRSHTYSNRAVFYSYDAEGDFDGELKLRSDTSSPPRQFTGPARSRSSTLNGKNRHHLRHEH